MVLWSSLLLFGRWLTGCSNKRDIVCIIERTDLGLRRITLEATLSAPYMD